ncbi:hypothetical protein K0A96_02780 [Patescibacteria group bacterium]|nr:hypothetical protein [Patescibacteria group bacterium]
MYIESRVKRSALMIVVAIASFVAVAYNGFDYLIFQDNIQATYRTNEINKEVDQVLVIETRELFRLDDFGSAYSIMANNILSTNNYAVWAVKDESRIPIKTAQWLILDTCEVRLSDESEFRPGTVTVMVRTLGD